MDRTLLRSRNTADINRVSARCLRVVVYFLLLLYAYILIRDKSDIPLLSVSFGICVVLALIPGIMVSIFHLEKKFITKHVIIICTVLISMVMVTQLNLIAYPMILFPLLLASLYYNRTFVLYSALLTSAALLGSAVFQIELPRYVIDPVFTNYDEDFAKIIIPLMMPSTTSRSGIHLVFIAKYRCATVPKPYFVRCRTIELFREGESGATVIEDITKTKANNTTLALGTYWSDEWLAYSTDANLTILAGKYPSYDKPTKNAMKDVLKRELSHVPTSISVNAEQRIVAYRSPAKVMSFDFETKDYYDIKLNSENKSYWLDDYIIWQHEEGKVTINDFNGNNYRELISESNNQLPVCLTENNRWLYYFDVVEKETKTKATEDTETTETTPAENTAPAIKYVLMREKLNI